MSKKVAEDQKIGKMREIIIETDGNKINLKKAEVFGRLELKAVLTELLNFINQRGGVL